MDTNQGSLRQVGAESAVKITGGGGKLPQILLVEGCRKEVGGWTSSHVQITAGRIPSRSGFVRDLRPR